MASDPDARDFTLNYAGGSLTMPLGNLKSLFGANFNRLTATPTDTNVSVKAHSRKRVIGGPSTNISGYSYTYKQWPTSQANNAAAGRVAMMNWTGSNGDWVARVSGAFADLGVYLEANSNNTVSFRSERGTKYGPFNQANP